MLKGQNNEVEWETWYGLILNAIYGGRVDNPFDMRVLAAYMK